MDIWDNLGTHGAQFVAEVGMLAKQRIYESRGEEMIGPVRLAPGQNGGEGDYWWRKTDER